MVKLLKRNPLVTYFEQAIVFSWMISIPLVFERQGWARVCIPYAIHYFTAFGPMLAGILMTAANSGKETSSSLNCHLRQHVLTWCARPWKSIFVRVGP